MILKFVLYFVVFHRVSPCFGVFRRVSPPFAMFRCVSPYFGCLHGPGGAQPLPLVNEILGQTDPVISEMLNFNLYLLAAPQL